MNTKNIAYNSIGIALYVAISMLLKIPFPVGHLALDCGYIVLAVYAYKFGAISSALVGGIGCCLVSLLYSGFFPIGWILGNVFIGIVVGFIAKKNINVVFKIIISVFSVFVGICIIKTGVECFMFSIPVLVKFWKNFVAFVSDAIVLVIGIIFCEYMVRRKNNE